MLSYLGFVVYGGIEGISPINFHFFTPLCASFFPTLL